MEKRELTVTKMDKILGTVDWTAKIATYPIRMFFEHFPYGFGANYDSLRRCQGERAINRFIKKDKGRNTREMALRYRYLLGQEECDNL